MHTMKSYQSCNCVIITPHARDIQDLGAPRAPQILNVPSMGCDFLPEFSSFELNVQQKKSRTFVLYMYLILVALYVKILRNCPFYELAEKYVATVICVYYVELCKGIATVRSITKATYKLWK